MRARVIYTAQSPMNIVAIRHQAAKCGFSIESLIIDGTTLRATMTSNKPSWHEIDALMAVRAVISAIKHRDFFLRQSVSAGTPDVNPSLDGVRVLFMMGEQSPHFVLTTRNCSTSYDFGLCV